MAIFMPQIQGTKNAKIHFLFYTKVLLLFLLSPPHSLLSHDSFSLLSLSPNSCLPLSHVSPFLYLFFYDFIYSLTFFSIYSLAISHFDMCLISVYYISIYYYLSFISFINIFFHKYLYIYIYNITIKIILLYLISNNVQFKIICRVHKYCHVYIWLSYLFVCFWKKLFVCFILFITTITITCLFIYIWNK